MKLFWRISAVILLMVLAATLVIFLSAGRWLETSAGRNLLQRELGKTLGLEAELAGDYELELFPGLQIAGYDLVLRGGSGRNELARLDSYQLHLALWPLLRKQVIIPRIAVHDGFLDMDLLGNQDQPPETGAGPQAALPTINSLDITGLRVLRTGEHLLTIRQLTLDNFADGSDADISLALSLPEDTSKTSLVQLRGKAALATAPMSLSLDVANLFLRVNERAWPVGAGNLEWSGSSGEISGSMAGQLEAWASLWQFKLLTDPSVVISARAELKDGKGRIVSAELTASEEAGLWKLDPVQLMLDGQPMAGQGCLLLGNVPSLHLQLQSQELDLDRLQTLLPEEMFASDPGQPSTGEGLPVVLAVELLAREATLSGGLARDVRLLLGDQPDCSQFNNPITNELK